MGNRLMNEESKLQQEILNDAKRKAERTVKRATRDAEKALEQVKKQEERLRVRRLDEAKAEAETTYRSITATISYEKRRLWLSAREKELQALFDDMLKQLSAGENIDRTRALSELLLESLVAIGRQDTVIHLNPQDRPVFTKDVVEELLTRAFDGAEKVPNVRFVEDDSVTGGLIAFSQDGTKRFDNRYATRMERLCNTLRTLLVSPAAGSQTDTSNEG